MNKTVEEPEIPSFSEYTKKALEEEDRKREGSDFVLWVFSQSSQIFSYERNGYKND